MIILGLVYSVRLDMYLRKLNVSVHIFSEHITKSNFALFHWLDLTERVRERERVGVSTGTEKKIIRERRRKLSRERRRNFGARFSLERFNLSLEIGEIGEVTNTKKK